MKKTGLFVLLFLTMMSCSDPDNLARRPDNVLSDTAFENLLVDFALAESAANMNILNLPLPKLDSAYAFDPLKQHGVSKEQYEATLRYFISQPGAYQKIYEQVLVKLSEFAARPPVKADSLAR